VFASLHRITPPYLNAFVDRLGEVMTESNILPYDGQAILIDDHGAEFDWPAITRTLIDTIPWQVADFRSRDAHSANDRLVR